MNRYERMFHGLAERRGGALVPFVMLGDPDPNTSLAIVRGIVQAGADALELGIPFSDPIADGPTIQRASVRALSSGTTPAACFDLIRQIREAQPEVPIGLLVYANLVARDLAGFYRRAAEAGVDSVLVADLPAVESEPFHSVARHAGIAPVLLLPHDADAGTISRIAVLGEGYTYVLGRAGVTGHVAPSRPPDPALFDQLRKAGGPPALVGFGVGSAPQVRDILSAGAAGAIVGSALVALVEQHRDNPDMMLRSMVNMVRELKAATRGDHERPQPSESSAAGLSYPSACPSSFSVPS